MAKCQADGCDQEARVAIRTLRPTRAELKSTIWYDDRAAPAKADRYCRRHGLELINGMADMLVAQ